MEMSPADAADGGNNFQQYNMNVNAPAETHNMMMMPSSRGAGVSGKSRDGGDGGDEPSRLGGLKETPRPAPPSVLPPMQHQHIVNKTAKTESGENLTVLVRGDNVFGTTVSKSFALSDEKGGPITSVVTVNISIASYRVVEVRNQSRRSSFRRGKNQSSYASHIHQLFLFRSPAKEANTLNSWSSTARVVSVTRLVCGNVTRTLMTLPKR